MTRAASLTRRRILSAAVLVLLFAATGLALAWHWAAEAFLTALERWRQEQQAAGYQITYQEPQLGGFPLSLDVRFATPAIAHRRGGWRWSGQEIRGRAGLFSPLTIHFELPRHQVLSLIWEGTSRSLILSAGVAQGLLHLDRRGRAQRSELDAYDLRIADAHAGRLAAVEHLRVKLSEPPARSGAVAGGEETAAQVALTAESLVLPAAAALPLGTEIARLDFSAEVIGPVVGETPEAALAAWREAGGHVEVTSLALSWESLALAASGTVALDAEYRPEGAFTAELAGLPETIGRFAATGWLKPSAAISAQLFARAMAQPRAGDGVPVVKLPVSLQEGRLYLGPTALFRLPPVLSDRRSRPGAPRSPEPESPGSG